MQINQQNIDDLNVEIEIQVQPSDYESQIDKVLKDYKKKASMPGFRPGMVPMGMIKKMYYKSVLADELNKLLQDKLYDYIDEQKLPILGGPLPSESKDQKVDLEDNTSFVFKYDLGLAPTFSVNLSEKDKFDYFKINIDAKLIERYGKDLRKRYGKVSKVESSEGEDMLFVTLTEVDKNNNPVEGGIQNSSTVAIEFVEDEKVKKQLIGLKPSDELTVDVNKLAKGAADLAQLLGIKKKQAEQIKSPFKLSVTEIYRVNAAEENQELYDKLFGENKVNSKEEFEAKISSILTEKLAVDSDRKLLKDVTEKLLEKLKLSLPDAFLKRWLVASNKEVTASQIDEEYDDYAKTLRWQLIEAKIVEENNLTVTPQEALEKAKALVVENLAQYGQENVNDEIVESTAREVLKKEDNARGIYEQVKDAKLMQLFKSKLSLKEKEVTFDEFVNTVSGKAPKNVFDKLSNLVKF